MADTHKDKVDLAKLTEACKVAREAESDMVLKFSLGEASADEAAEAMRKSKAACAPAAKTTAPK